MTEVEFYTEKFEKDSLAVFERTLQGFRKAKQSKIWESNMEELVDKLTLLPTDPFTVELMRMFDYEYLVLSNDIETIIDKSLIMREQMKYTKRSIRVNKKYFRRPFLSKNTYLKRLDVYNYEGELCYSVDGNISIKYKNIFKKLNPFICREYPESLVFNNMETHKHINLEIFHYSPLINCLSTDRKAYYDFFCDYFGKVQFIQFYHNKETNNDSKEITQKVNSNDIFNLSTLTDAQQILWAYFFLSL